VKESGNDREYRTSNPSIMTDTTKIGNDRRETEKRVKKRKRSIVHFYRRH